MALDEDQVHLVGTGRNLLMGATTRFDLQEDFNPFNTQVLTPQSVDRPYAHGALVGAEWMAERVVPIRVIANGLNRDVPTTRRAVQDMSAAFSAVGATGEIAELHFRLPEDPDEFMLFGRPRGIDAELRNAALGYAYVSTAFVASDPRIYSGALTSVSTGLPVQRGGLTIPAQPASSRLRLPGTAGSYASTPSHASLQIVGDLDVRARIFPRRWTGGGIQTLAAIYGTTLNQRAWQFVLQDDGILRVNWSTDGTNATVQSRVSTVPVPNGGTLIVRFALDVDNGAGGNVVTFYTGSTITGPWTQLGSTAPGAGVTSVYAASEPLLVGAANGGASNPFRGVVLQAQVRSGISGTVVANPDFTAQSPEATGFTDSTSKTWAVNGAAKLVGGSSYRGGLTYPTTVKGVLVGGVLTLTNSGTTNAPLRVRIDGPVVEPGLVLRRPDGTVQTLSFALDLAAGQWLDIDTAAGTAFLNGLPGSNQRGVGDWQIDQYPLQPGVNRLRFSSAVYNDAARMTAEYRSAWW